MGRANARRLGTLPNANGTITRLAYAHAKAHGVDPRALLPTANLTIQQINDASARFAVRDQISFLNLVAVALQDDHLGFHLALSPDLRELGFLYYVSASSGTLGDALYRLARYSGIVNEGVAPKLLDGGNFGISFHYVGVGRHLDRHQIEFFMTILVRLCRHLTGVRLVPTRVRLTHRLEGDPSELTEFFGAKVEFGASVDEVLFEPAIRNMPVVSADHYLNKILIKCCDEALDRRPSKRGPFRASVENAIVPLLPHGKAKLDEIARRLGVSERTLARRLAAERLTFSGVLERLKFDLAERYLADKDLSISQVAWLLGYQEVSSLTHAFKRWTGLTPRKARARKANWRPSGRVILPVSARRRQRAIR
jgi:AraC-like DNA-binding protein